MLATEAIISKVGRRRSSLYRTQTGLIAESRSCNVLGMSDVPYHGDAKSAQLVRVPLDRNTPAKHWLFVFRGENEAILHRYEIDFGITNDPASCTASVE